MVNLPYITSPGNIDRALTGIKAAAVPPKVTQDFVKTILNIKGGSGDQMTAFLKKIGFAASNGDPTDLYRKFRNPLSSGAAVASAIRIAYAPLYVRNEYMHDTSDEVLLGMIVEETGQAADANSVKLTFSCIKRLKTFAKFGAAEEEASEVVVAAAPVPAKHVPETPERVTPPASDQSHGRGGGFGLNLGYTINLNLPATADPAVFDAIFSSLKKHLLSNDDA